MDIYILDENFRSVEPVIDAFESFLWVDRYSSFGDFELYTAVDFNILRSAQQDRYIWTGQSDRLMIIDERIILSDIESGNHLQIKGRSLESILERRIVWAQTNLTGNFQNGIQRLINESIINPAITDRKIPNFIFLPSTDPRITSLTIDSQFTGTNLYDAVKQLCEERKVGFKVFLNDNNQFVFTLYIGIDRSYDQVINPYVVFSPGYENIINSNYLETSKVLKNVALVAGEGEGNNRRTAVVGSSSGLARRELFVDARDISSNIDGGTLSPTQYDAKLKERGNQRISEYIFIKTFEGDVETTQMFVYGEDFFLGDIVQIVNEFGIEASTRIVEIIFSYNNAGDNIVPTFSVIS